MRQHFCAISYGLVVGTVSLRPLDEATLQLKQMAVAEDRRREGIGEGIGARMLAHAEGWAHGAGFLLMVLNARMAPKASTRGSATRPMASRSTRTPSPISG